MACPYNFVPRLIGLATGNIDEIEQNSDSVLYLQRLPVILHGFHMIRKIPILKNINSITKSIEDVNFKQNIKYEILENYQTKIDIFKSYFFGIHRNYAITLFKVKYTL